MAQVVEKETMGFQTEAKQLLHLMIHSLYSNKEIFLRELISNASDAADKLRFEALSDGALYEDDPELKISIEADKDGGTLSVRDNGIGMSREEVISNLGTIARSGTAEFVSQLSGDERKDSQLIGQFGVGFYSAFMVSDRIELLTRRAGLSAEHGVHWQSEGEAEFSVESVELRERGTTVILHLKSDAKEFLDEWQLRSVIKKYSDHISIPVQMKVTKFEGKEGEEEKTEPKTEIETVNQATALWTRSRTEIKDEEYIEFYKHVSHDFTDPLSWSHNRVEGKTDYTSLVYIPAHAPFDLWNRDAPRGLKLYIQRTFIMDEAEQFLPLYLRFVKGVVDCADLPLNISREILQKSPAVDSIKSALTKRVLDMLEKLAKDKPEEYAKFWAEFGQVIKEGPAEDFANREKIAGLFRFATTMDNSAGQDQSLADYVGRMKDGQEKVYYLSGESLTAARNSPHLERLRKKGIEVLLLTDRIDEWMISYLHEFDGKSFQDVARGELDLGKLEEDSEKKDRENLAKQHKDLVKRVSKVLGERVKEVRVTDRLTESPACLVVGSDDMGVQMRKILQSAGQDVPETKPVLELNPEHPLVVRLNNEPDEARFDSLATVLFEQSQLASGLPLDDPADYVKRLNALLLESA